MAKEKMTKFKWLASYQKECSWLEEMALKGWFLENMTMGIFYTFRKGEPKRMMYEIDRFSLPKNPSIAEIRHKEIFIDLANQLGWNEVTHDESMTYYFSKEYEEGGINELYNEEESRIYRAKKFSGYLRSQANSLLYILLFVSIVDIFIKIETVYMGKGVMPLDWYHWFTLVYVVLATGVCLYSRSLADRQEKELIMTRSEWADSVDRRRHKVKRKLVFTVRGLNKMLMKEAKEGWVLNSVTPTKYFFDKSEGTEQSYTMDTKWLTNQRRKGCGEDKISDRKDWTGICTDWQLQSVKDAEEKGWQYVCALENRTIIYRGPADRVQPLNDAKYNYSLRCISLIGAYGVYLLCCALVGGMIGFLMAYFGV